jgi:hypothetical protein
VRKNLHATWAVGRTALILPTLLARHCFSSDAGTSFAAIFVILIGGMAGVAWTDFSPISRQYCYNNQTIDVPTFQCRRTFIGSSVARSGLERLPMLINVLRGDMSIVGLRCYVGRLSIQLSGQLSLALRNGPLRPALLHFEDAHGHIVSRAQQIEAELFYASNWSLLLDAKILFRNFFFKAPYIQNHLNH